MASRIEQHILDLLRDRERVTKKEILDHLQTFSRTAVYRNIKTLRDNNIIQEKDGWVSFHEKGNKTERYRRTGPPITWPQFTEEPENMREFFGPMLDVIATVKKHPELLEIIEEKALELDAVYMINLILFTQAMHGDDRILKYYSYSPELLDEKEIKRRLAHYVPFVKIPA